MSTELIEEIHRYRAKHAEEHDYDLNKIVADIRKGEERLEREGWNVVVKTARRRAVAPLSALKSE